MRKPLWSKAGRSRFTGLLTSTGRPSLGPALSASTSRSTCRARSPRQSDRVSFVTTTPPDRDKLLRSVQDSLEGLFFLNDGQVAEGETVKLVAGPGQPSGVHIRIQQVPREVAA